MFGKNSARVLITGRRPEPSASVRTGELPQCTDLVVLGQVVRALKAADDHPFLKRESVKRGTIPNICDTTIHFIEAKKSYDFFADDGRALTLTDEDLGQTAMSTDSNSVFRSLPEDRPEVEVEDLTGKDLLQLIAPKGSGEPFTERVDGRLDSAFDEEDLKEGAYFILQKRLKAPLAGDKDTEGASVAHTLSQSRRQELSVFAGTLGRIEKRAGFRSESLWIAEILPYSAPRPFWRSLLSLPGGLGEHRDLPKKVILASSQMVEINHFFDQYGVECTRFGEESNQTGIPDDPATTRLPEIYAPSALPLAENIATAQRARMLEAIQEAALGLLLVFKDPGILARRGTLVLEESTRDGSRAEAAPHLLRRQCFLGLDRLGNSQEQASGDSPALLVSGVDVKVFRPMNSAQVPPGYYAIDLELALQPNFSLHQTPLVCRFPLVPIDAALVDMAERILSSRFAIQGRKAR
jgi:hypothetical protein